MNFYCETGSLNTLPSCMSAPYPFPSICSQSPSEYSYTYFSLVAVFMLGRYIPQNNVFMDAINAFPSDGCSRIKIRFRRSIGVLFMKGEGDGKKTPGSFAGGLLVWMMHLYLFPFNCVWLNSYHTSFVFIEWIVIK